MKYFKIRNLLLLLLFILINTNSFALDLPYSGNESTWSEFCTSSELSQDDKTKCEDFKVYLSNKNEEIQSDIDKINNDLIQKKLDIEEQAKLISTYNEKIKELELVIVQLEEKIKIREAAINEKSSDISRMTSEVDFLTDKVRSRMVLEHKTMHFNDAFNFLMGAYSFEDLIRRANGLSSMEVYESNELVTLQTLLDVLEQDKKLLEYDLGELEVETSNQEYAMTTVAKLKEIADNTKRKFEAEQAELEALGNKYAGDLESIKATLESLSSTYGNIVSSTGFHLPVDYINISANTWYYPGGGIHLGTDFAVPAGTSIYAPANGVVVFSSDGCADGWLGNSCSGSPQGASGGGNQINLIVSVNEEVYGFKVYHMLAGTPIEVGSVVNSGDVIGKVGTSGYSSGPHAHIEVVYLGTGNVNQYVEKWYNDGGDLSFGGGYGYQALNRLCDDGVSAPCRMRPEKVYDIE